MVLGASCDLLRAMRCQLHSLQCGNSNFPAHTLCQVPHRRPFSAAQHSARYARRYPQCAMTQDNAALDFSDTQKYKTFTNSSGKH